MKLIQIDIVATTIGFKEYEFTKFESVIDGDASAGVCASSAMFISVIMYSRKQKSIYDNELRSNGIVTMLDRQQ